jgi:hypothetical protein
MSCKRSHQFVQAGWNFAARPVRASEALCLRCHRGRGRASAFPVADEKMVLKIGDTIGVVLYGYRKN